jgi:Protein of unknown function (DUF2892)
MTKNIAAFDRIGRIAFGLIVLSLYLLGKINGVLAISLGALSVIFLITSLLGFCPIYRIFGISSCKIKA